MRSYKKTHKNHNRIRYGWRISKLGYHMVDAKARETVIEILILRNRGCSFEKIKEILEEKKLPSPRNSAWHCGTIRKIVTTNSNSLSQKIVDNY